jgi:peptide chain release factor 2
MVTLTDAVSVLQKARTDLKSSLREDEIRGELTALLAQMSQPERVAFAAEAYGRRHKVLFDYDSLSRSSEEAIALAELVSNSGADEDVAYALQVIGQQLDDIGRFVLRQKLTGPYDGNGAILTFNVGMGRGDGFAHAAKLCTAYDSFSERQGWSVDSLDEEGDTIVISGRNAYGLLKGENGIHRLEYISSNSKTQTSTVAVSVTPIVDMPKVEIRRSDIYVEELAASTKGGQRANGTCTGIRLTYLPTGITATSRKRKQSESMESAMMVLRSRVETEAAEASEIVAPRREMDMAYRIRTYDTTEERRITDHRTNVQVTGKGYDDFMRGALGPFIFAMHGLVSDYRLPQ